MRRSKKKNEKKKEEDAKKKQEDDQKKKELEDRKKKEEEDQKKKDEVAKKKPEEKRQSEPTLPPAKSASVSLRAIFDFNASDSTELSFKEGDIITLVKKFDDSDWWEGQLNGKKGLFPGNFVEPVQSPVVEQKVQTSVVSEKELKFCAIFDFDAQETNEISFKEGDIITLVEKYDDSEWWKGKFNGKVGLFPSNFTKPC